MADTLVDSNPQVAIDTSQGLWGPYWIDALTAIIVFFDGSQDLRFTRTTDGGANWSSTLIQAGTTTQLACWFDRETPGDAGTLIHIAWLDNADDACYYRTVDISDGSIGTLRTIDNTITVGGAFAGNRIAITKTVSGNLIVAFSTQSEIECYRSDDSGATWVDRADVFETATEEDWLLLFPADTGDDDDAVGIFWDRSANEISMKMYDESANSWTETSISGSVVDDAFYMNMDASVRHSDKHILLALHSDENTAGDDILTYDLTVNSIASPTSTAKANVVTNQNGSAQIGMFINQQNDDVYVAYLKGGTWQATVDVVYHKSTNGMTSWGTEQAYKEAADDDFRLVKGGRTVGNDGGRLQWVFFNDDTVDIWVNLTNDIEIAGGGIVVTPAPIDCISRKVDPSTILGSIAYTPTAQKAIARSIDPLTILGGISLAPSPISSIARNIDPSTILGSITMAPQPVDGITRNVDPGVVQSSINYTPTAVDTICNKIDPSTVLGSITLTPSVVSAIVRSIDPSVIAGGDIIIIPTPVGCIVRKIDPGIVLGSLSLTPSPVDSIADRVDPTTILGSISYIPSTISAIARSIDPLTILGGISLTPSPIDTVAKKIDPGVVQSSISYTPTAIDTVCNKIDPGIVLGSLSLTPTPVDSIADRVDPSVVLGTIILTPSPSANVARKVDPAVVLGTILYAPLPADVVARVVDPSLVMSSVSITPSSSIVIVRSVDPAVIGGIQIILATERRIFTSDTERRVFTSDTERRVFVKDTEKRVFTDD